jgi:hypothetical protein
LDPNLTQLLPSSPHWTPQYISPLVKDHRVLKERETESAREKEWALSSERAFIASLAFHGQKHNHFLIIWSKGKVMTGVIM